MVFVLLVFFWGYRQKKCDNWRSWTGIVSTSLAFDTGTAFLILLKNKNCEKAPSKLNRNCLDSLAFDTSSAFFYNIAKKWNWWNYNILEFICILDDFLIFHGICSVSFLWDYRQKRCDIWRRWAGIVSSSLAFDTSSAFLILLKIIVIKNH